MQRLWPVQTNSANQRAVSRSRDHSPPIRGSGRCRLCTTEITFQLDTENNSVFSRICLVVNCLLRSLHFTVCSTWLEINWAENIRFWENLSIQSFADYKDNLSQQSLDGCFKLNEMSWKIPEQDDWILNPKLRNWRWIEICCSFTENRLRGNKNEVEIKSFHCYHLHYSSSPLGNK